MKPQFLENIVPRHLCFIFISFYTIAGLKEKLPVTVSISTVEKICGNQLNIGCFEERKIKTVMLL